MNNDDGARAALRAVYRRDEGCQYGFVGPDGTLRLGWAGLADRLSRQPVTEATTFHCFSTTKVVTALAVLQLVAQGLVDLDAPLARYLPELPYRNGATVRQTLSHQAGLPNPIPLTWVHRAEDHERFDRDAFHARVLREHPSAGPAGRRAAYSNIGFLLLGKLVESLSGLEYERYVRERVLAPLPSEPEGVLTFAMPAAHATGYTRVASGLGFALLVRLLPDPIGLRSREGAWIRYHPFHLDGAAYGGLLGNALGWAPLLRALAQRDERLLPRSGYEQLFAGQPLASGAPSGHALAWFTGVDRGHEHVRHAGGGPGYYAELRAYPKLGAASVLLTNTTSVSDLRLLDRLDSSWLP